MTQLPLVLHGDLALWLKCGLVKATGCTASGVVCYALTPAGRALLANRLASEAK